MQVHVAVAFGLMITTATAGPPAVKTLLDHPEKGCAFTWHTPTPIGPMVAAMGQNWFFSVDYVEAAFPLPAQVDMAIFTMVMQHRVPPHAGEGLGAQSLGVIDIRGDGFANGKQITGKPVANNRIQYATVVTEKLHHGAHWDVFAYHVAWKVDQGTKNIADVTFHCVGSHSTNLMDGAPRVGKNTAGSDGKHPRISMWGPSVNLVPIGTPYFAILIEDTTLPLTTTQPLLMLGGPFETAFGGGVELPIDLTPHGAPGFELWVDPLVFLPAQPPLGNHHCEIGASIPNDPRLIGELVWCQWLLRDPTANAAGLTLTEATAFVITE